MESELSTFRLEETRSREETFKKQREATLKETELYRQQQQATEEILAGMRAAWELRWSNKRPDEQDRRRCDGRWCGPGRFNRSVGSWIKSVTNSGSNRGI